MKHEGFNLLKYGLEKLKTLKDEGNVGSHDRFIQATGGCFLLSISNLKNHAPAMRSQFKLKVFKSNFFQVIQRDLFLPYLEVT